MFNILINVFEQSLIIFFLYSLSETHKKHSVFLSIITGIICFMIMTYINSFSISQSLLIVIFVVIVHIYIRLTTYNSKGKSIVYALLPFTVITVSNSIIDMSVMLWLFPTKSFYEILATYQIPFDITIQIIHTVCFYFIAKFIRNIDFDLPEIDWFYIAILAALCNVIAICLETVYLELPTWKHHLLLGTYCVALFVIIICFLFKSIYNHILLVNKQKLEIEMLQGQIGSNKKLLAMRQEINTMRHDMKHFINLINKNNSTIPSDLISDILNNYDSIKTTAMPIQTISPAINYVLNIKQDEAISKGISFICSLNITQNINMDDSDLYLLLSNILDNAIAHIGLNKTIRITMKEVKDTTMIQIRNSVNGTIIDENGEFYQKDKTEFHGYGIQTIQTITKNYSGNLIFSQEGDELICTVFLPLKKQ